MSMSKKMITREGNHVDKDTLIDYNIMDTVVVMRYLVERSGGRFYG